MSPKNTWDMASILSSEARFKVLEILAPLHEGLGLRALERASHLKIRSIQVATSGLLKEGILKKNARGFLQFNARSVVAQNIQKFFAFIAEQKIAEQAISFSPRAKQVLELSENVRKLVLAGTRHL